MCVVYSIKYPDIDPLGPAVTAMENRLCKSGGLLMHLHKQSQEARLFYYYLYQTLYMSLFKTYIGRAHTGKSICKVTKKVALT